MVIKKTTNFAVCERLEMSEDSSLVETFALNKIISPVACASIVNEILKVLLYQKSQIPFPYTWLRAVVNKKRNNPDANNEMGNVKFSLDRHFQIVSKAHDTIEKLMISLQKEFQYYKNCVKEIVIIFGATPYCPKEVFRININASLKSHCDENHIDEPDKLQQKILRNIILSQSWMDATRDTIQCTNTYIFIKKNVPHEINLNMENNDSIFVPSSPLMLTSRVKYFEINLNVAFCGTRNCCGDLTIFEEHPCNEGCFKTDSEETNSMFVWSQSKELLKGFKDYYVNNVSACELW